MRSKPGAAPTRGPSWQRRERRSDRYTRRPPGASPGAAAFVLPQVVAWHPWTVPPTPAGRAPAGASRKVRAAQVRATRKAWASPSLGPARLSWEGSACSSRKAWVGPARSRSRAWVGSAYASSRAEQVQPAPHTLTLQSLLKGTVPGTGPASLGFPSESLPGCTCFSTQGLSLWFSSSLWLDLGRHGPTSDLQNRKPSLYPWCWWADG